MHSEVTYTGLQIRDGPNVRLWQIM